MKLLVIVAIALFSISCSAQEAITGEILYELTKRTIEGMRGEKVKIVKSVAMPSEFWDNQKKRPMPGRYLSAEDLESISRQVNNPTIKTWDVGLIREIGNVRIIKKPKGNNCVLISLPIYSADLKTIVICYQSWNRHSGAGFVVVWKKDPQKEWIMEKEEMIWITRTKAPAHNKDYLQLRAFVVNWRVDFKHSSG